MEHTSSQPRIIAEEDSMLMRRIAPLAAVSFLAAMSTLAQNQGQKGAGVTMAADADSKDIGLPLYPGSRRHIDKDSDSPGINFGLWGGGSGVKLAVLKMESDDSMEKVAEYYRKQLSKRGKVLDCTNNTATESADKDGNDNDGKPLTCGTDKPDKGGLLYKSGTKPDQYLVSIQPNPNGKGSLYQLVHLAHWGK
jgi:hypothetical protein